MAPPRDGDRVVARRGDVVVLHPPRAPAGTLVVMGDNLEAGFDSPRSRAG